MDDFYFVARLKEDAFPLSPGHNDTVSLDGDTVSGNLEFAEQVSDSQILCYPTALAVYDDLHRRHPLRRTW